jgi:hypothetical protein
MDQTNAFYLDVKIKTVQVQNTRIRKARTDVHCVQIPIAGASVPLAVRELDRQAHHKIRPAFSK